MGLSLDRIISISLAVAVGVLAREYASSVTGRGGSADAHTSDPRSPLDSAVTGQHHPSWRDVDDTAMYYGPRVQTNFVAKDRLLFRVQEYEFAMVADLDLQSRDPEQFLWHSFFLRATLRRRGARNYTLKLQEPQPLYTHTAKQNRSMELSTLVHFRHLMLAMCDFTGLVFKIVPGQKHVLQRYAIADGDGNAARPMKMEWATVKEGRIWLGGVGKEWNQNGVILHRNAEWVKTIDYNGRVENYDWGPVYQALRFAANATAPGYLWHEAVTWDARSNCWIFLPRKRSMEDPYTPEADETKGTNIVLIASEDFSDIEVRTIGPLEPEYGFTAVRKIPGTVDEFVALKVREIGDETHTKLVVFDLDGNLYLEPAWEHVSDFKYEGLDFL